MAHNSIGLIELGSIAAGFLVCDTMLKTADVELLLSRSICSGKYMVMIKGDVGAVQASVKAGILAGNFSVIDSFVIPNVHESIFPAIAGHNKVDELDALGIIESFSVASLIEGADAAIGSVGLMGWHHVAEIADESTQTMRGYVDGVARTNRSPTPRPMTAGPARARSQRRGPTSSRVEPARTFT